MPETVSERAQTDPLGGAKEAPTESKGSWMSEGLPRRQFRNDQGNTGGL